MDTVRRTLHGLQPGTRPVECQGCARRLRWLFRPLERADSQRCVRGVPQKRFALIVEGRVSVPELEVERETAQVFSVTEEQVSPRSERARETVHHARGVLRREVHEHVAAE